MKRIFQAIIFSVVIIFSSCSNNVDGNVNDSDTVNFVDANGLRQGHWVLYGRDSKDPFPSDMIWREGNYVNGKEEGKWIEHSPSGNLMIEKMYHEGNEIKTPPVTLSSGLNAIDANGKRQGPWIIYGKMQNDKAFNPTSKYEEGTFKDDLKEGEWTQYNPDGTVKRKVNYVAGEEVK